MSTGRKQIKRVEIQIADVVAANAALERLGAASPDNQRLKISLGQVRRQIQREAGERSAYDDAMQALVEECGLRDDKGAYVIDPVSKGVAIKPDKIKDFRSKSREAQQASVVIDVPALTPADLGMLGMDPPITVDECASLWWLIDDTADDDNNGDSTL
jgi:hypothetical protein